MTPHPLRMAVIIGIAALGIFWPFLPGKYDGLAVPISTTVQLLNLAGLLLAPLGAAWLSHEWFCRRRRNRTPRNPSRGYYFGLVSLATASVLGTGVSLIVLFGISTSFGVVTFVLGSYATSRCIPKLQKLKTADAGMIPALYMTVLPCALLLLQVALAGPLTAFSRRCAIANSNEFVNHIERYRARQGRYPASLAAVWKDYYPDIVGIEKFHYMPYGESYNLFFEQPRLLFDNIGTREWVVYNPRDEHRMFSHTSWFLLLAPEQLEASQGWYAVHDAEVRHWKYYWFD